VNSREATDINFIVFGLIWLGPEPTINCNWGEHANPIYHRCSENSSNTIQLFLK